MLYFPDKLIFLSSSFFYRHKHKITLFLNFTRAACWISILPDCCSNTCSSKLSISLWESERELRALSSKLWKQISWKQGSDFCLDLMVSLLNWVCTQECVSEAEYWSHLLLKSVFFHFNTNFISMHYTVLQQNSHGTRWIYRIISLS